MDPKVSICIPTYNQVDKLEILLNSIRSQTYRDFEVIVSDDSTTQDVKNLLDNYADLSVRYFHNFPSKGSPENCNHAISLAKGTWIKLMHHDDYFIEPESLFQFISFAQNNEESDFIYCRTAILHYPSNRIEKYNVDENILNRIAEQPNYLFFKNLIGSPSVTFFRSSEKLRFDKQLKWLVDIEAYIRFLSSKKIGPINQILIGTSASDSQLTEMMRDNPDYELTEFLYCYAMHYNKSTLLNKRILNTRLLLLFRQFGIDSEDKLVPYLKGINTPTIANLYFYLCTLNRRLAFSILYRINKFVLLT